MRFASALILAAWLGPQLAAAQSGILLKEGEVTEGALIEALAPPRTRSIKASAPGSASLLITFETNSTRLTPPAERALDIVGGALKSERLQDRHFVIEGHADRRGRPDANQRLSAARANAVRTYLTRKHGVAEARLTAVGKGDTEPQNAADPAAPENRRVTFVGVAEPR
jgi:outer membrane protein OmpA-like peptidoglycan-associated protein